jgi:SNF2 family DNA or RNA helicase
VKRKPHQRKQAKLKLFPHQEEGLRRVLNKPFYPLFMEMGTGKTAIAIKAIEHRYRKGLIHKVLIFAPKTILHNWEIELDKFLNLSKSQYIIERFKSNRTKKDTFYKLLEQDLTSYSLKELHEKGYEGRKKDIIENHKHKLLIIVVNFEKALSMYKELLTYNPQMLIIDESHKLKQYKPSKAKTPMAIYKLTRRTKYRIIMTGTPVCNGYEDLFMQYKILDESIFGVHYKYFEERYIEKGGYMNYQIIGYRNVEELRQIVKDTSYAIKLDDCVALPRLLNKFLFCDLNPKARKAYQEIDSKMLTEIDRLSTDIKRKELKRICREKGVPYLRGEPYISLLLKVSTFINVASCELVITQQMRLQQIAGGFLTMDDKRVVKLGNYKYDLVKEVVMSSTRPIVVFCQYIPEIDLVVEELSKLRRGNQSLRVRSFRNPKTRELIYEDFTLGLVDVLVLQLSSGSVGLNLQKANKVIFYSWNYSSDDYIQGIHRIKRSGQLRSMQIIHLIAEDTVDSLILDIVNHKRNLANKLFK